jgi:hypothetical protein
MRVGRSVANQPAQERDRPREVEGRLDGRRIAVAGIGTRERLLVRLEGGGVASEGVVEQKRREAVRGVGRGGRCGGVPGEETLEDGNGRDPRRSLVRHGRFDPRPLLAREAHERGLAVSPPHGAKHCSEAPRPCDGGP